MRTSASAVLCLLLATAGCSAPEEKDPDTGFPRVPPAGMHFSLSKSVGGKTRHYEGDHPEGKPAVVFETERLDDERWALLRFEVNGKNDTPADRDLDRVSIILDAVVVPSLGTDGEKGPPHEHPLRASFRDVASGKRPCDWQALLPRVLGEECPAPATRRRLLGVLIRRAEDPEKLSRACALALASLELDGDPGWRALGLDAAATRRPGVARLAVAAAARCTLDDSKLAVLRAVAELPDLDEAEQLELVGAAAKLGFDASKAEILVLVAHRLVLAGSAAIAIADAAGQISLSAESANVLCALASRGRMSEVLENHYELSAGKVSIASERQRAFRALELAKKK